MFNRNGGGLEFLQLQNSLVLCKLDALMGVVKRIEMHTIRSNESEAKMSADTDRLKEAVRKIEDRGDATIALLRGVAQIIRDNIDDKAAILEAADRLDTQAGEFDEVIMENTTPPAPTT